MRQALGSLTVRGRGFLAAGITTAACAILLGFDALLRIGVLATALPLLTVLIVARTRYRLTAQRTLAPARVQVGEQAEVGLSLVNVARFPLGTLMFEDAVPYSLGRPVRFRIEQASARWKQHVTYRVRSSLRGVYELGPLSVRVSDPFGFVALTRSYADVSELTVTPAVLTLPANGVSGEWAGSGDRRPRAFAGGSAEDVTVREYRRGDDLRRVHWPSSARLGDLMVRREEQPWQSRATVLLDTRLAAHEGRGSASSLEWAVVAAASVVVHLAAQGFAVRLLTDVPEDDDIAWHEHATDAVAQVLPVLGRLATIEPSPVVGLEHATRAVAQHSGLVVALIGRSTPVDVETLGRARARGTKGLALVLDPAAWVGDADPEAQARAQLLGHFGWRAAVARPDTPLAALWTQLGTAVPSVAGGRR